MAKKHKKERRVYINGKRVIKPKPEDVLHNADWVEAYAQDDDDQPQPITGGMTKNGR